VRAFIVVSVRVLRGTCLSAQSSKMLIEVGFVCVRS
jgi:hypothetical protein